MLSESERRCLTEIEYRLRAEEPALANAMDVGKLRVFRPSHVLTAVFGVIGGALFLLGSFGPAMGCFGFATVALLSRGFTWH